MQKDREKKWHARTEWSGRNGRPRVTLCAQSGEENTDTCLYPHGDFHFSFLPQCRSWLTKGRLLGAHGNVSSTLRLFSSLCNKVGAEDKMKVNLTLWREGGQVTMETNRVWNWREKLSELVEHVAKFPWRQRKIERKYLCMSKGKKKKRKWKEKRIDWIGFTN